MYHPDKVRANASINLALAAQVWQQLNECKYHLFDEVRRKFYDMKIGHSKMTPALVRLASSVDVFVTRSQTREPLVSSSV